MGDDAVWLSLLYLLRMENPSNELPIPIPDRLAAIQVTAGYGAANSTLSITDKARRQCQLKSLRFWFRGTGFYQRNQTLG